MSICARILVILVITLGFPLHNFVERTVNAGECVLMVDPGVDADTGQALPDKPSPSCKVVGANQPKTLTRFEATDEAFLPAGSEDVFAAWWPGGPEKPPKQG